MNTEAVAFILIILVISASVFITVSNMNKTVQELSNTVSSISAELNTIKQAINMTEDYRVLLSVLGPIALEKLEKTVVLEDYIIYTVSSVGAGDILAPHLYEFYFDGVDDYISVAHSPSLDITNAITIASLVYPISFPSPYPRIVTKELTTGTDSYALFIRSSDGTFCFGASGALRFCGGSVMLNAWHHVAVTWNNITQLSKLYVNGSPTASSGFAGPLWSTTYNVLIGNNPTNIRQYRGLIASVSIYARALSDSEIQQLYSNNIISTAELRLFLDATFFNSTHYVDISGNGNHAKPYNGTTRVLANETWIWILKSATADPGVWLRFFPSGTLIVYRNGEIEKITSTEYYTTRTDIMLIVIPREVIK